MSLSLLELYGTMGLFAKAIVWILAAMSVYSWASAFQKLYQIVRSERETRRLRPSSRVSSRKSSSTARSSSPRSRSGATWPGSSARRCPR